MPRYDVICPAGHEADIFAQWDEREVPCATCGQLTVRVWKSSPRVVDDSIPGGFTDHNLGPEPITYYSKSERKRLMRERGLVEVVRHVGYDGGDKSPHTSRWV